MDAEAVHFLTEVSRPCEGTGPYSYESEHVWKEPLTGNRTRLREVSEDGKAAGDGEASRDDAFPWNDLIDKCVGKAKVRVEKVLRYRHGRCKALHSRRMISEHSIVCDLRGKVRIAAKDDGKTSMSCTYIPSVRRRYCGRNGISATGHLFRFLGVLYCPSREMATANEENEVVQP